MAYQAGRQFGDGLQKYWLRMALLGAAVYLIQEKDMAIDLRLSNVPAAALQLSSAWEEPTIIVAPRPLATSLVQKGRPEQARPPASSPPQPKAYEKPANVSNLANTYSNLSDKQKGVESNEPATARLEKRRKQERYVKRFFQVAQTEMDKFGIPASITLAQGLLESNVGESKLATNNNNHFGIKCFSRSCRKGHCSNFTDDSHKDFFRKYKSAWESYRAHSLLLKHTSRYERLFGLGEKDYRAWAKGLSKAGYATDKRYAEKLINLIEDLKLHQYDR